MSDTNGAPKFLVTGMISTVVDQLPPAMRIGVGSGPSNMLPVITEVTIAASQLPYSFSMEVPATVGTLSNTNKHCFYATTDGTPLLNFEISYNVVCAESVKAGVKNNFTSTTITGSSIAWPGGTGYSATVDGSDTFVVQAEIH